MAVSSAYVGGAAYFRSRQPYEEMFADNIAAMRNSSAALMQANAYQNASYNQQLGNYQNSVQALCSPYNSAAAVKPVKKVKLEASPSVIIAREGWGGGEAKPKRRGKNPKTING